MLFLIRFYSGLILTLAPICVMAQDSLRFSLRMQYNYFDKTPLSTYQTEDLNSMEVNLAGKFTLTDTLALFLDGTAGAVHYFYKRLNKLNLEKDFSTSKFSVGYDTLNWSKSEFARLSNVTNAKDYRLNPSGETTLGQSMVQWKSALKSGTLTAIYMPYAIANEFSDASSRQRTAVPITGAAQFERSKGAAAFALRYDTSFEIADIGVYAYRGHSNEAAIIATTAGATPYYAWVDQVGFDLQLTYGAAVGKFELRHTQNQLNQDGVRNNGWAASIGGEYSFYDILSLPGNLTAIGEFVWDERGIAALTRNQKDLFIGLKWSLQNIANTHIMLGMQQDLDFNTKLVGIELKHRIIDGLTAKVEAYSWLETDLRDPSYGLRQDNLVRLSITKNF